LKVVREESKIFIDKDRAMNDKKKAARFEDLMA
jgi:hypothetical protein